MAQPIFKTIDNSDSPLIPVARVCQVPDINRNASQDIRNRLLAVQLPSPPQTLLKLLTLCRSDDTGMNELSALVGTDPAMTAKVLAVAHSAAFHRSDAQPLTLFQACSRLGTALIKVLVISESVLQTFNAFSQATSTNLDAFWQHSLRVAVTARELAKRLDATASDEAYLSGLLHDVGRLALLVALDAEFQDLFDADDDDDLLERELARVAISHTQAGAWLLDKWQLGAALIESVSQHHADDVLLVDAKPLTRIVHLAHTLAAIPLNDLPQVAHLAGEQGLSADDMKSVLQTAALQVEQIARDLGLSLVSAPKVSKVRLAAPVQRPSALQSALANDVFDRSVFNEMTMTLVSQRNLQATLVSMRQHASALLQLEDCIIFLLRDSPRMLVAASMNDSRRKAGSMSFGVESHALVAQCVDTRKVVFSRLDDTSANALHQLMDTEELLLIPLLTAQSCLGVLLARVPAQLSDGVQGQLSKLQAFGFYAGLALAQRHQADNLRRAQIAVAKQEGRLELLRISRGTKQLIDQYAGAYPCLPVDLCSATREMLQLLRDSQLIPEGIHIKSQLIERQTLVRGSAEMIMQVVHILLKNAWQSLPDGGDIGLEAGALVQRQGAMFNALSVTNNAINSSTQQVKAQLYEPISGKTIDEQHLQGSGGLSVANFLVEKMGGHIKFNANEFGYRFDVYLPCVKAA